MNLKINHFEIFTFLLVYDWSTSVYVPDKLLLQSTSKYLLIFHSWHYDWHYIHLQAL